MTDFELWKEWFIASHQPTLVSFYEPLIGNPQAAVDLIERCRDLRPDRRPLRIMNAIERLGCLSGEMLRRQPGDVALTVLFLVICIEAIYAIAEIGPDKKVQTIIDFFQKYLSDGDRKKLLGGICRSIADDVYHQKGSNLRLEVIARIVNELRNLFAHEGKFSAFNFAGLNVLEVREAEGEEKIPHTYDVTLPLVEFRDIILRGCVNFLRSVLGAASSSVPEPAVSSE